MNSIGLRMMLSLGLMTVIVYGCAQEDTDTPVIETPEMCFVEAPEPATSCVGPILEQYYCTSFRGEAVENPQEIESQSPLWVLQDRQPQSCSNGQHYGLVGLSGRPTMIVLLWAGCGFCQIQTEKLQQMHFELQAAGADVDFAIVNRQADNPLVELLSDRCSFPIFQDVSAVDVWGLLGGQKDDFYFYDSNGILRDFIPHTGDIALSTESGYANIKNAVLDLVENDGQTPTRETVDAAGAGQPE